VAVGAGESRRGFIETMVANEIMFMRGIDIIN